MQSHHEEPAEKQAKEPTPLPLAPCGSLSTAACGIYMEKFSSTLGSPSSSPQSLQPPIYAFVPIILPSPRHPINRLRQYVTIETGFVHCPAALRSKQGSVGSAVPPTSKMHPSLPSGMFGRFPGSAAVNGPAVSIPV